MDAEVSKLGKLLSVLDTEVSKLHFMINIRRSWVLLLQIILFFTITLWIFS